MNLQLLFGDWHHLPFSNASICSGVKDVRLRCNLRFKRKRAAESTSEPSLCDESSVLESTESKSVFATKSIFGVHFGIVLTEIQGCRWGEGIERKGAQTNYTPLIALNDGRQNCLRKPICSLCGLAIFNCLLNKPFLLRRQVWIFNNYILLQSSVFHDDIVTVLIRACLDHKKRSKSNPTIEKD